MAVLGIVGTVLITILKALLILLLLVLAIVFLVLFVPVRYGVWLEKEEGFSARARASWLCRLVSFRVLYEGGKPELTLRVFGFNLLAWLQKRRERVGKDIEGEEDFAGDDAGEVEVGRGALVKMDLEGEASEENGKAEGTEEADISMAEVPLYENGEDTKNGRAVRDENLSERDTAEEDFIEEDKVDKKFFAGDDGIFHSIAERFYRFWEEILRRLKAIADFFKGLRKIVHKLRKRAEWLGQVKDFWHSENTRQMVCIFWDNVLHLWRKLKPRTVKGQVWFGTGNPCSTGQILGVCAIFFACYGNGIAITPDFERQVLEGKLMLKGHVSLITAVVIIVKVFFSRQWKTFRREWDVIGGSFNE